jgi:alpha-tubulin suppressor-like RCC1 family protein
VIDVLCGDSHALALTSKGQVYGWGQGMSKSKSLIKNLKKSFQNNQNDPENNQLEVICFYPRLISEVDILHNYLIKGDLEKEDEYENLGIEEISI